MAKIVRMSDIAERLGVSTVTVSKALAGKDGVSETLRQQIQQVAEEMGYRKKNTQRTELVPGYTIGIVTSKRYIEKGHSFYWSLYERLLANLSQNGHIGILEVVSETAEAEEQLPRIVLERRIDGMIIMGAFTDAYRELLNAADVPCVALDSFDAKYSQDSVISDGYYGMYAVTHYLLQMGHREIMFVGTLGATGSITDRYYGCCRALLEAGLPPAQVLSDRAEDGMLSISIESLAKLPTAFACNCDVTAHQLLNCLKEHGVRVPEDVSVVGFDNFILSELAVPKLTTYAVDLDRMSAECVALLQTRLAAPKIPARHVVVSGSVVIRDSVRRLK